MQNLQAELVSTHLSFPSCVHKNSRQLSGRHKAIIFYLLRNTAALMRLKQNQTAALENGNESVFVVLVLMLSVIKFPLKLRFKFSRF